MPHRGRTHRAARPLDPADRGHHHRGPAPSVTDPGATAPPGLRVGGPDTLHLGYETAEGDFEILAALDGRYLTTEVAGGFTGRVIGMYAIRGSAAFDWFGLRPA